VLNAVYVANPVFIRRPKTPVLPEAAWINEPFVEDRPQD